MKKQFYTLAFLICLATSSFAQFTLTVTVPSTTLQCYASGGFNSWGAPANTQLALVSTDNTAGTSVFGIDLPLTFVGSGTFQILAGSDWAFAQSDPQFTAIATAGATTQNVVVTSFKALPSPIEIDVTVPSTVNECYVVGYWGWTLPAAAKKMTLLSSAGSTKVFSYTIYDKVSAHVIAVKFLAGLDGTLWTYQQTQTADFTYSGTASTCSFDCELFNAIGAPEAVMTINADKYSIKTIDRKIQVEGKYSNVTLYNVQGRMIHSTSNQNAFTSANLNPGLYIIQVDGKSYKQIIY